ncbi:TPA: hypothetical protein HA338_01385 [Methanosarcina acetivorans]|uniref:Uncharacterized protein n=1 Tax=Methanosarcina acetivorans TaxID=2214 RepID=A0A832SDC8_9EURY|nr:hypothetical protein [Methanosarcina acetivorans]HIH92731.1 hypothetical protein [Methanosarcina acetivorans]
MKILSMARVKLATKLATAKATKKVKYRVRTTVGNTAAQKFSIKYLLLSTNPAGPKITQKATTKATKMDISMATLKVDTNA